MTFSKQILALAESVGIQDAQFVNGTMLIPYGGASLTVVKRFVYEYTKNFAGKAEVTLGDDEILVDFVLSLI